MARGSWVPDKVSMNSAIKELRNRMDPSFMDNEHCTCPTCTDGRRNLLGMLSVRIVRLTCPDYLYTAFAEITGVHKNQWFRATNYRETVWDDVCLGADETAVANYLCRRILSIGAMLYPYVKIKTLEVQRYTIGDDYTKEKGSKTRTVRWNIDD